MLATLLERLGRGRHEPLGAILVSSGVITPEQLKAALETQRAGGGRLGRVVLGKWFASEYDVLQAIAAHHRVSATELSDDFAALLASRSLPWREKLGVLRIPIRVKLSIAITFMILVAVLTLSIVILGRKRRLLYEQAKETGRVSLEYFTNAAAALREIGEATGLIEQKTGWRPTVLAYPCGETNGLAIELLGRQGYRAALQQRLRGIR